MNLISSVNGTSVTLEWGPPLDQGGRADVVYNVVCRRCAGTAGHCEACGSGIRFVPQQMSLVQGALTVTNLLAHTNYSFWVEAVNGVSDLSLESRRAAVANITTNQAGRRSRLPLRSGHAAVAPASTCPSSRGWGDDGVEALSSLLLGRVEAARAAAAQGYSHPSLARSSLSHLPFPLLSLQPLAEAPFLPETGGTQNTCLLTATLSAA